jgi:hypothetical protein
MSVGDLLGLHSNEALSRKRHLGDPQAEHGDDTRVSTVYDRKAAEIAKNPAAWGQLDEPIRSGSIDPVLLSQSGSGHTVVIEGQHRIVRAHQLGVTHLPVSYDPGSQEHRYDWEDPEPLDERTAVLGHFEAADEKRFPPDPGTGHVPENGHRREAAARPGQDENGEWFYGEQPAHTADLPPEMHRGVGYRLAPDVHAIVHDPSRPLHERAQALLSVMDAHSARNGKYGDGGVGIHWSVKPSSARGFATRYDTRNHSPMDFVRDPESTQVIFHARTAEPSQMLRGKRSLDEHEIFGINHGEGEIPLRKRSRVHLTGISWAPNGDKDAELTRFDFPEPVRRGAGVHLDPAESEAEMFRRTAAVGLLGHFEAADYSMQHRAPSPAAGHRSLDRYQGGSPDDPVRVYRAAPPGTESINPGDWISLSSEYAHGHGRHPTDPGRDWPVYTAEVPQRHVHWDENDENEHGYNGPRVSHPDVHDEETGEHHDWHAWHEDHPHGMEAWAGASAHLPHAEHDFVHDEFEWEPDRADTLLNAARAQGSLRGAQWRDDLYPARDDAEEHAAARLGDAPQGHRTTAFTVHRLDDGTIEGVGIHHYEPAGDPHAHRRYQHIDVEDHSYRHPAVDDIGHAREAAVQHDVVAHFAEKVASLPKSGMAWVNQDSGDKRRYTPVSVRHAGFAGLVGDRERDEEMREARGEDQDHDSFDEDLYDESAPEPTEEEQAHYEEHGEHPESYYERRDQAYADALRRKQAEDEPDHDDPDLMRFVGNHGSNADLWKKHGTFGPVDVRKPVYATQSHVAKEHIERYLKNPRDTAWHTQLYGDNGQGYLGDEHPMFVTHEGRLHATEGHHRIAAALVRGDSHVHGWHFNLDEHPHFADMDEDEAEEHMSRRPVTSGGAPGEVHRGIGVHLEPEEEEVLRDKSMSHEERAHYLMDSITRYGREPLGHHWSTDEGDARRFSESHSTGTHAVVFHATHPEPHEVNNDPSWRAEHEVNEHEHEVPVHGHAEMEVNGISWRKREPGAQWEGHRFEEPEYHKAGSGRTAMVVAHFAEPGSPVRPGYQQKLFHVQPDPALNTLETGRHNPEDPLKRVRHRQETEEGYVPPVQTWDHPEYGNQDDEGRYRHPGHGGYLCHACTQNEGEAAFHADPEESERHDTAYTNWDEEYPRIPATVHRGMRIDDDGSEGRHHMLRGVPAGESAARTVLHHLGDFGTHWTGDEQQARHYADVGTGGYRNPGNHDMNVVVHARKPEREDIETDPETLAGQNVFGMGYHDDEEIPLREGAPVHVTGVSWKFHDEPHDAWRRHDFGEHPEHTAALDDGRRQRADMAQSMLAYDKDLSDDDRAFVQSAIDHIRRGAPASEPIDADDAERMARGMRARDRMEQAGWTLGPGQDKIRYGRGFTVNVGEHHRATLSPNSPSGWHVRTHPADYGSAAGHLHHDLDVDDEDLPSELHKYYASPQIRGELAAQRAEMIAEGSEHTAALEPPAPAPAVPSFTWRHQTYGPNGGYADSEQEVAGPFYHGSRSKRLQPGSMIRRGMPTNPWGDEGTRSQRVHFTTSLAGARTYARDAGGHVYEVEPTGDVTMGYSGDEWKSEHPLRVIRRVPDEEEAMQPRTAALPQVVAHFEPPGHFAFYHGEGSEDGRPRTSALEEHLYGNGHGRPSWDTTIDEAIPRAQDEAYSGEGTNTQKRQRYHQALEGLHQHEHEQAGSRAQELERGHHQQWQDEWEERGRHQEDLREHYENGEAHMHGRDVPFHEMESHLQVEHGIPGHALPQHRLPVSDHDDPYQRELEEMHEQHHGEHTLPDTGSYRHTPHGQYVTMHWGPRTDFDAEHHLVEHHGMDIDQLRHDEPDLEDVHRRDHEQNRSYLDHHLYTVMDPENHLPSHPYYSGPDAGELREGDPEHHFEVQSRDEEGNEHRGVYHAEDEDHAREMHEDVHPYDEEAHHVGRAPVVPPRRQYTVPAGDHGWEPPMGGLQAPNEHGEDLGTAATWQHVPYAAPPRSREELEEHIRTQHGSSSAGYGGSPSELHASMHDSEWAEHQHDYPEGHDPVFGSAHPVIAHFDGRGGSMRGGYDQAQEALRVLGAWEPQDREDAVATVRELPSVLLAFRNGLASLSAALAEAPVHAAVRDAVHDLAAQAGRAAQDAEDLVRRLPTEAAWEDRPNR